LQGDKTHEERRLDAIDTASRSFGTGTVNSIHWDDDRYHRHVALEDRKLEIASQWLIKGTVGSDVFCVVCSEAM
jgi:hypothetical protein